MNNRIVRGRPRFTLIFSFLLFFLFPILLHAATLTVNNTTDTVDANPGDGLCADDSGNCTLRAAIQEANALSGADRINLPTGTYILNIEGKFEDEAATGDLDITDDVTIIGDSAADTKIDADKIDTVLSIKGAINVEISGVTIMHGFRSFGGGGIRNEEGIVTLINCMVTKNFSTDGSGIDNDGTLALINSTVSNNSDIPSGEGGSGIYNTDTLVLLNSTISDNGFEAPMSIGGIANGSATGATTTLIFSTISGNKGVGIGGVNFGPANGTVTLIGSIIATNSSKDCVQNQFFSLDYNIDSDGSCNLTEPHDLPNTNPIIGPLADNGGPTLTHALLEGSPAIDAGDDLNCPETDQRGVTRPQDGDDDGEAICDIGAHELVPLYIEVEIDIIPGSYPNSINLLSRGVIPVAVLTTEDFDSLTVDADSVWFGPDEAEKTHKQAHVEDVDDDGDLDLLLHFRTQDTGIAPGDTEACLIGETYDGMPLEGCDAIRTVPLL